MPSLNAQELADILEFALDEESNPDIPPPNLTGKYKKFLAVTRLLVAAKHHPISELATEVRDTAQRCKELAAGVGEIGNRLEDTRVRLNEARRDVATLTDRVDIVAATLPPPKPQPGPNPYPALAAAHPYHR